MGNMSQKFFRENKAISQQSTCNFQRTSGWKLFTPLEAKVLQGFFSPIIMNLIKSFPLKKNNHNVKNKEVKLCLLFLYVKVKQQPGHTATVTATLSTAPVKNSPLGRNSKI